MKKILLTMFLLSISSNAFAEIEKWECYAPKNSSKFADTTVVGTYKLDTDNATVAYLSNGNWKYYDWCCDINFDKEKKLLYFSCCFINDLNHLPLIEAWFKIKSAMIFT